MGHQIIYNVRCHLAAAETPWDGIPSSAKSDQEVSCDAPIVHSVRRGRPCIWTAVPSGAARAPDLDGLTTQQAADDLCSSKFTSTALVSAAIARAKANPNLNAFVTLDEAGAMKAAAAFDAGHRKRSACKPLGGVPIVIKDNIEVAGLPSSAGTPALKGFVPKAGCAGRRKAARGRRHRHRQDRHARARLRHLRLQDRHRARRAQRL